MRAASQDKLKRCPSFSKYEMAGVVSNRFDDSTKNVAPTAAELADNCH
jgi:hypothetical protein